LTDHVSLATSLTLDAFDYLGFCVSFAVSVFLAVSVSLAAFVSLTTYISLAAFDFNCFCFF
jgi:hypothetical protein